MLQKHSYKPGKILQKPITTQNKRASMTTSNATSGITSRKAQSDTQQTDHSLQQSRHKQRRKERLQAKQKKIFEKNSDWGGGAWRWGSRGGGYLRSLQNRNRKQTSPKSLFLSRSRPFFAFALTVTHKEKINALKRPILRAKRTFHTRNKRLSYIFTFLQPIF